MRKTVLLITAGIWGIAELVLIGVSIWDNVDSSLPLIFALLFTSTANGILLSLNRK